MSRRPIALGLLVFLMAVSTAAVAQGTAGPVAKTKATAAEPSMADTRAWLERDAAGLAVAFDVSRNVQSGAERLTVWKVTAFDLTDCVLSYAMTVDMDGRVFNSTHAVPLKTVALNGLTVTPHVNKPADGFGWTREGAFVNLVIPAKTGHQFSYTFNGRTDFAPSESISVRDAASATRILNAIRHAATLCGNAPEAF